MIYLILIILFFVLCGIVGFYFDKKSPSTNTLKVKINEYGKSISNLIMVCSIILFVFSLYLITDWTKQSDEINEDIKLVQNNSLKKVVVEDNNSTENLDDKSEIIKSEYEIYSNSIDLNVDFDYLKSINKDTTGWLKVENTNINYPTVKYSDNVYYLKHTFSGNKNTNGWVYMDYRNDPIYLDKNTIFYAHNLYNKAMFGTLNKVLEESWINNENNRTIKYVTENFYSEWKIFSVYINEPTTEYLKVSFKDNEFLEFIDTIKAKSIYVLEEDFSNEDKIMTFSTCNNTKRIVVHSKLTKFIEK